MPFELTFHQKPGYLHAVVTGPNTTETVRGYLEALMRRCAAEGCRRLLIEERLEGPRLGTMDVFDIAAQGSERFRGMFQAIGYVDVNARGELMEFAETVAVNRALPLRVFSALDDAERWLAELG